MPRQTTFADAFPRKRFFVEMFTRDIAFEDCILDLVDNSIDSLIRTRSIDLEDDTLVKNRVRPGQISVDVSSKRISVTDNCGGIPLDKAMHEVFTFGHSKEGALQLTNRGLGAYGIGLKRAIFKMGRSFQVDSSYNGDSFRVAQDLEDWLDEDDEIEQWRFPLNATPLSELSCPRHGTRVEVKNLGTEIQKKEASLLKTVYHLNFILATRKNVDTNRIYFYSNDSPDDSPFT